MEIAGRYAMVLTIFKIMRTIMITVGRILFRVTMTDIVKFISNFHMLRQLAVYTQRKRRKSHPILIKNINPLIIRQKIILKTKCYLHCVCKSFKHFSNSKRNI